MNAKRTSAIAAGFCDFIGRSDFRCGWGEAIDRRCLRFVIAHDLQSARSDAMIARELQTFVADVTTPVWRDRLAVTFEHTARLSEKEFDEALSDRLLAIRELDGPADDCRTPMSCDPDSELFSFRTGGHSFLVVGLHPSSSHMARRFVCPVLVFNPDSRFEHARHAAAFESNPVRHHGAMPQAGMRAAAAIRNESFDHA